LLAVNQPKATPEHDEIPWRKKITNSFSTVSHVSVCQVSEIRIKVAKPLQLLGPFHAYGLHEGNELVIIVVQASGTPTMTALWNGDIAETPILQTRGVPFA
jgi:hypothetical protein